MTTLMSALNDALAARYPTVAVSPNARFLPMLDLSKGELSSTAAIEIARALRGDARTIAAQLVSDISQKIPGDWKVIAGYIVLSLVPVEILKEEVLAYEAPRVRHPEHEPGRSIVCLVPDSTSPVYARLRLIACGALQALLAVAYEGECRVACEPDQPRVVRSSGEIVDIVARAVERCLRSEGEARLHYEVPTNLLSTTKPLTVWTSHHYHDRLPRSVKDAFTQARNAGTGVLKIPADGWLLCRDRALSETLSASSLKKVIDRLSSQEAWLRWVYHFASSIPSGDLDPSVALYDECASPRWTLQVLHQRVSQLVLPHVQGEGASLVSQVVSAPLQERDLLLRSLFIRPLTARAIQEGEVLAWSAVIEEFASRAHALLNSPAFRRSLTEAPSTPWLMQINAGLVLGVTGILPAVSSR